MKNSKYEFKVLVDRKNIKEYEYRGDTYIEGRKGSNYELYFKNNTYNRVEVIFSVDGLSIIDGKTASDKSTGYIVNAYDSITVPGWKINSSKVAQFQFQPQNDKSNTTYVELLAEEGFNVDTGNQGVLGCMVFVEKPKDVTQVIHHYPYYSYRPRGLGYPLYEYPLYLDAKPWDNHTTVCSSSSLSKNDSSISYTNSGVGVGINNLSSMGAMRSVGQNNMQIVASGVMEETSMGTAFGDDKKFETTTVEFERKSNFDWIGVINYDTIQGLRKRGVLIVNSPKAKAFPNFKDEGCPIPSRR